MSWRIHYLMVSYLMMIFQYWLAFNPTFSGSYGGTLTLKVLKELFDLFEKNTTRWLMMVFLFSMFRLHFRCPHWPHIVGSCWRAASGVGVLKVPAFLWGCQDVLGLWIERQMRSFHQRMLGFDQETSGYDDTVDGRNPESPWMVKNPLHSGINHLSTGAEFLPSTVGSEANSQRLK